MFASRSIELPLKRGFATSSLYKFALGSLLVVGLAALGAWQPGVRGFFVSAAFAQEHGGGCSGGGCGGGGESESGHAGGTGGHAGGGGGGGHGAGQGAGKGRSGHASGIHGPGVHGPGEEEEGTRSGFSGGGARHVPAGVAGGSSGASGARLGRLNAAHAYLSPGFKSEHIMSEGESESPLYQLGRYQQELQGTNLDVQRAGEYLGNAATITVTPAVVSRVNEMMGVTVTPAQAAAIAAAAEAQRLSNKESHDEGEESSHEHSSP